MSFMLFVVNVVCLYVVFFFQAEDGIRDLVRSRGLGDVYKRQVHRLRERGLVSRRGSVGGAPHRGEGACFPDGPWPVSYTHLTLPTIYSV